MDHLGRVDAARCHDLETSRRLEWLVTNGRGGYAMATVPQMLTRRYHGLLVAAVKPPVDRFVLLAKLDVTATIDGLTYELATNDYCEAVHPHGYKLLMSFDSQPYPTWRFKAGSAVIEQTLCMRYGSDCTFVRYRLVEGDEAVTLTVRPLCAGRHYHHLEQSSQATPEVTADAFGLRFGYDGDRPDWSLSHNGNFRSRSDWYYDYDLIPERERGYDSSQDLFMPGPVTATLNPKDRDGLVFAASTDSTSWAEYEAAFKAEAERGEGQAAVALNDRAAESLLRATGDFLVRREDQWTVVAGYPWFGDWGRDTFISLPGLCLVPGRFDEARGVFRTYAAHLADGMVPNRFPDYGDAPQYNTCDASLWYVQAADRFLAYTGDWSFVASEIYPAVCAILDAHERGTRHGIALDGDGLLRAGEPGFALTWMDAKLPDYAVTPRIGKPVEINALWYNALRVGAAYANRAGDGELAGRWAEIADRAFRTFNERFWNPANACLFDVIDVDHQPGTADDSIRPNQLFAISLSHPILHESRMTPVVTVCERELWTPMGMRTLACGDPQYKPCYTGDLRARDEAYHQGTVWPWLLGPFVSAFVRSGGNPADARRFLDGLSTHFGQAGLGGVSEVASGDAPHTPGGCPWQAWSVAEPLRALCEDVLGSHPPVPREKNVSRNTEAIRPGA